MLQSISYQIIRNRSFEDQIIQTNQMEQQVYKVKGIVSFPPIQQMIVRYNSISSSQTSLRSQILNSGPSSFSAKHSSLSLKNIDRSKIYASRSPAFFKKRSTIENSFEGLKKNQQTSSSKQVRRLVDKQHVLATYKKMGEERVNPRLMEKAESLYRMSNYENFAPFKRNFQINRKVFKADSINPETHTRNNSSQK